MAPATYLYRMPNPFFRFKQFTVQQDRCAMKVCTDACLFGAWTAHIAATATDNIQDVLDIGAGTGLLSLMLAQALPETQFHSIEIDPAAAAQARENIEASPWHTRLVFTEADIRQWNHGKQYDLIISNPPFFERDLKSPNAQRNLALHEQSLSLQELLTVADAQLTPEGRLAILLPFHRKEQCIQLASENGLYPQQICDVRQTDKHGYFRTMLLFVKQPSVTTLMKNITIKEGEYYSEAFTALLKEYYLYL
jgi:tRNA1Val (adenine37-N6)-methyltransferase